MATPRRLRGTLPSERPDHTALFCTIDRLASGLIVPPAQNDLQHSIAADVEHRGDAIGCGCAIGDAACRVVFLVSTAPRTLGRLAPHESATARASAIRLPHAPNRRALVVARPRPRPPHQPATHPTRSRRFARWRPTGRTPKPRAARSRHRQGCPTHLAPTWR